jgi:hypothetical protein
MTFFSNWLEPEQSQTDLDGFIDAFQGQVIYHPEPPNQPDPVYGANLIQ